MRLPQIYVKTTERRDAAEDTVLTRKKRLSSQLLLPGHLPGIPHGGIHGAQAGILLRPNLRGDAVCMQRSVTASYGARLFRTSNHLLMVSTISACSFRPGTRVTKAAATEWEKARMARYTRWLACPIACGRESTRVRRNSASKCMCVCVCARARVRV